MPKWELFQGYKTDSVFEKLINVIHHIKTPVKKKTNHMIFFIDAKYLTEFTHS